MPKVREAQKENRVRVVRCKAHNDDNTESGVKLHPRCCPDTHHCTKWARLKKFNRFVPSPLCRQGASAIHRTSHATLNHLCQNEVFVSAIQLYCKQQHEVHRLLQCTMYLALASILSAPTSSLYVFLLNSHY